MNTKQIIAFFFLFVFLFNSVGYFFVFRFNQMEIKNDMRAAMLEKTPDSRFIPITVSSKNSLELSWSEDNEFSYKGSRYDIVRMEKRTDGSVTYLCLNDAREDELFRQMDENLSTQLDANKTCNGKTGKLLLKLLAFDYFCSSEKTAFYQTEAILIPSTSTPSQMDLSFDITTPPPRIS
jgi:hypothetical protein